MVTLTFRLNDSVHFIYEKAFYERKLMCVGYLANEQGETSKKTTFDVRL